MPITKKSQEASKNQVFISYSNENVTDRQVADRIYDTLKARGIPCWVAHRDIPPGFDFTDAINRAISDSRIMIVVLSKHTENSNYVEKEVTLAVGNRLTIIPFCIEELSLSGGLNLLLSNCHRIDAYPNPQDNYLDQLVKALQRYLGIEPEKVPKKEEKLEKPLEVDKKSLKSHRLKRILLAASIIIAVIAVVIFVSQLVKPEKKEIPVPPIEPPDFINALIKKGWDVKKNENDSWEAYYKNQDITMIYIPPGKFKIGSDDEVEDEKPLHEVELDPYWIGKYEVTFAQYDRYCQETRKEKPGDQGWGRENRPVINITWGDAGAYCDWLTQKTGLKFDLPTEAQWEKASRGSQSFRYPWGNEFDRNKCNSSEKGLQKTMAVGTYPFGKSPYGCMDMAGNVQEWCSDWFEYDYYKISPPKNPRGLIKGDQRILRGGSWSDIANDCRVARRNYDRPNNRDYTIGFRLMMII